MTYFAIDHAQLKPLRERRTVYIAFAVALLSVMQLSEWSNWLEKHTGLTWLFSTRGEIPPPDDIIIIALNSAAADRMGLSRHSYTWPRTVYADVLQRLQHTSARLIIMDIAFRAARDDSEDAAFEAALADSKNVILYKYLKRIQVPTADGHLDIEQVLPPLERFSQHALASGFFVLPKTNSRLFSAPLVHETPHGLEAAQPLLAYLALQPPHVLEALWQALTAHPPPPEQSLEQRAKTLRELTSSANCRDIPAQAKELSSVLSTRDPMVINFYGDALSLNHIEIDRVLQMDESSLANLFNNKIVYLGYLESWQTEQQDAYTTVFTSQRGVDISGVEISATVLANLLHNQQIHRAAPSWQWLILAGFFVFGLLAYRFTPGRNILSQFILLLAYGAITITAFSRFYTWLPIAMPLFALATANGLQWHHHYQNNRQRLRDIRKALSQYLPERAADRLSYDISALARQHQVVSGVVLMTDIKGYTRLSEQLPPDELHTLMNRYYDCLVRCVKRHEGFIGNIVGDSLLALWVGPQVNNALCSSAYHCALDIATELQADREFASRLPTCFAVHGGRFSLGNLGAPGHYEYSPVGDIINTTSRIEHFNREVATALLVSATVADILQTAKCKPPLRYLGAFNMRNKAAAVPLYTTSLNNPALAERFAHAVTLYQQHHFADALDEFNALFNETHDGPCEYYAKACRQQLDVIDKPS